MIIDRSTFARPIKPTGMMRLWAWAPAILCILLLLIAGGVSAAEHSISGTEVWRVGPNCGVNATYAFLRLHGAAVSYEQVRANVPVTSIGSNLKDIRDCAAQFGVAAAVVRATPTNLTQFQMPVIAHVENQAIDRFSPDERGHFIVIVGVNADTVRFIDGNTAMLSDMQAAEFMRQWSGYLLVRKPGNKLPLVFAASGALLLILSLARLALRNARPRPS